MSLPEWMKNKRNIVIIALVIALILVVVFTIKKENIENPQPSPSVNCLTCNLDSCGTKGDSYCNKECTQFNMKNGKILCVKK
jgi:hypothetical protein